MKNIGEKLDVYKWGENSDVYFHVYKWDVYKLSENSDEIRSEKYKLKIRCLIIRI